MTPRQRQAGIAKIHIAKAQIGMSDDAYRQMLRDYGGVEHSNELSNGDIDNVLARLRQLGFVPTRPDRAGRKTATVGEPKQALLEKVNALLAEQHLPTKYGDAIAKRMYRIDRLEFCGPTHLRGVIAALYRSSKAKDRDERAKHRPA